MFHLFEALLLEIEMLSLAGTYNSLQSQSKQCISAELHNV